MKRKAIAPPRVLSGGVAGGHGLCWGMKEAKKKSVLLRAAAEDGILHSGGPLTLAAPALHRTAPRGHAECICDRAESSSARVRVARLETSELAHFFMSSRGCRPPSCSSMGITVAAQLSTMW